MIDYLCQQVMGVRILTPACAQKGRGERIATEIKHQKTPQKTPPQRMQGDSQAFGQLGPLLRRTYPNSGNNGSKNIVTYWVEHHQNYCPYRR